MDGWRCVWDGESQKRGKKRERRGGKKEKREREDEGKSNAPLGGVTGMTFLSICCCSSLILYLFIYFFYIFLIYSVHLHLQFWILIKQIPSIDYIHSVRSTNISAVKLLRALLFIHPIRISEPDQISLIITTILWVYLLSTQEYIHNPHSIVDNARLLRVLNHIDQIESASLHWMVTTLSQSSALELSVCIDRGPIMHGRKGRMLRDSGDINGTISNFHSSD